MRLRLSSSLLFVSSFLCAVSAQAAIFEPLFMVTKIIGDATVTRPDGTSEPLLVDHAYPYGSRIKVASALTPAQLSFYKAAGAEAEEPQVSFTMASDYRFRLSAGTEATILDASTPDGERKIVDVAAGTVNTFITAASTKTGGAADSMVEANLTSVTIRTPIGECTRLTQRNQVQVSRDPREPSVCIAQFASQSGIMEISGPQYKIYKLRKNTIVDIEGTDDFTTISASHGEFTCEFEKGADAVEKAKFRTRCIGKIWREYAEIGGRMAVSVMISYPDGKLITYNYLDGQTGVGFDTSAADAQGGRNAALDAAGGTGSENALPDDSGFSFGSSSQDFDSDSDSDSTADSQDSPASASDSFDFGDW